MQRSSAAGSGRCNLGAFINKANSRPLLGMNSARNRSSVAPAAFWLENVDRCGAQRELRENLRPIDNAA
jgi:hypothetical protein